jgi:hypothetical protein
MKQGGRILVVIFASTCLQGAKKLDPSFLMRYAIFSREQQHMQKNAAGVTGGGGAGGAGGQAATDLVSYVEFQRNYRWALCHAARQPTRTYLGLHACSTCVLQLCHSWLMVQ